MPRSSFLRPRVARIALLLSTALLGFAATPSPATAGGYWVYSCKTPDGRPAPTDGWKFEAPLAYGTALNACPGGAMEVGLGSQARTANVGQRLFLQLPDDLALRRATLHRMVWVRPGAVADWNASPFAAVYRDDFAYSQSSLLENCAYSAGCQASGFFPGSEGRQDISYDFPQRTRMIGVGVACGGIDGGQCAAPSPGTERATIAVGHAALSIEDDSAPEAHGLGGTLREAGARSGTETLSFEARDRGAGTYQAVVLVDGQEHQRVVPDANGGRCADAGAKPETDLEFLYVRPCPPSVGVSLKVDTTKLAEGRRLIQVKARDAAGNETTVFDERVTIDNIPGPVNVGAPAVAGADAVGGLRPGDRLSALPGAWTGPGLEFTYRWQRGNGDAWNDIAGGAGPAYTAAREDIGLRLRVVVRGANIDGAAEAISAPTGEVQSGATVQPQSIVEDCGQCNGNGGDASTGQLVVDREQRSIEVAHGAQVVITGRLLDAEGRPLANAAVDVFERLEVTAAQWRQVATITTDAQGGYAYRPKSTGSRTIRFAYAARRGGADYRATRDVTVAVRGKLTASAARRVLKPGALIRLKGRLTVDALPKGGTWVEVQVLDAGVWRTIGTRRTSSRGLWKFNHRLRRSRGVSFRFRARLRVTGDVPSAATTSPTVKVRVR